MATVTDSVDLCASNFIVHVLHQVAMAVVLPDGILSLRKSPEPSRRTINVDSKSEADHQIARFLASF